MKNKNVHKYPEIMGSPSFAGETSHVNPQKVMHFSFPFLVHFRIFRDISASTRRLAAFFDVHGKGLKGGKALTGLCSMPVDARGFPVLTFGNQPTAAILKHDDLSASRPSQEVGSSGDDSAGVLPWRYPASRLPYLGFNPVSRSRWAF